MKELVKYGDITPAEHRRDRMRLAGAASAWFMVPVVPALILAALGVMTAASPAIGLSLFVLSAIWLVIGLILGIIATSVLMTRRISWKKQLKKRISREGIRTRHVDLFLKELKPRERRALKEIEDRDPLLGDAYRETLASRLTSTKILKLTDEELADAQRRRDRVRKIGSSDAQGFIEEIETDIGRLWTVRRDAEKLLGDSELRLETIEATARRGSALSEIESGIKRLSERSAQLPIALEAARVREEVLKELEMDADVSDIGVERHSPSSS